jgi:beta-mannanase
MMARSGFEENRADSVYRMQRIIDGDFDAALSEWFRQAARVPGPLLVEFGTEVNGEWFPWNGKWNGAGETTGYGDSAYPDGPERFRDAYRHIIDLSRQAGADNITWFFHLDALELPETAWNRFELYYPGDAYIDWIGVSVYGPFHAEEEYEDFDRILRHVYNRIRQMTRKPVAIAEFGVSELN